MAGPGTTSATTRTRATQASIPSCGKVIVPDVLLQPHSLRSQMTFYDGGQFPAEYQGDTFAAQHGSWNRESRSGYEVVPRPDEGRQGRPASTRTS